MKVSICIGSACHLKGSREIIQKMQELIKANALEQKVELSGAFCCGNCVNGVTVTLEGDSKLYSVSPETCEQFFEEEILRRV